MASSNRVRETAWIESSRPQRRHLQPHSHLASNLAQMASASRAVILSAVSASKPNRTANPPLHLEGLVRATIPTMGTRPRARSLSDSRLRIPTIHLLHLVDSARRAILPARPRPTRSRASLRRLSRTAPKLQTHSRSARNRPTASLVRTVQRRLALVDLAHPSHLPHPRLAICLPQQQTPRRRVNRHSLAVHRSSISPQRRQRQMDGLHSRVPPLRSQLVTVKLPVPAYSAAGRKSRHRSRHFPSLSPK